MTALFVAFEEEMASLLLESQRGRPAVEDVWLQIRGLFDLIWRYQFLYRDLNDILSRNRTVELQFKRILQLSVRAAMTAFCDALIAAGEMQASRIERDALADNIVVVASYWMSYEYVRNPRERLSEIAGGGCLPGALRLPVPISEGDRGSCLKTRGKVSR